MSPPRSWLLFGLVLLLGLGLRWAPANGLRLGPDERDLGDARWLVDHPETCEHLRRIELGLAEDRVPERDPFVNFPSGGELPSLPVFDTFLAGVAQRLLRAPGGDVALGGVSEPDLEEFAVRAGPALGLLVIACAFLAARAIVRGVNAPAAFLAALVCAVHPLLVEPSSAGRLDSTVLAAALLALLARSLIRSLRSESPLTAILDALIAGAVAGLLVATSGLGAIGFACGWCGYLWAAWRGPDAWRSNYARAGLLYCAVAAFLARLPLAEGPWESGPTGVVGRFQSGVTLLLLISSAPFLVSILRRRAAPEGAARRRTFQVACFVVALGVFVWQVPVAARELAPALSWFARQRADVVLALPDLGAFDIGRAGLARAGACSISLAILLGCWKGLARRPIDAARLVLLLLGSSTFVASILVRAAAPFSVVAVALMLAARLDDQSEERAEHDGRRSARPFLLAVGAAVLLLAIAWLDALAVRDPALREERIAFVSGLRWMRANTPAPGPWNSARALGDWGVLASVESGALVEYHARRPALQSPAAALSGVVALRECGRALWTDEPTRLARFAEGQRARYVVAGARAARHGRDRAAPADLAALDPDSFLDHAATALAFGERAPGFERVHASPRRVGLDGRAPVDGRLAGPAISIWAADARSRPAAEVEMRAR